MRIICTLLAAIFALSIATAAAADCGCSKKHESCGCTQKHEDCGCARHKKCGGDVELLPRAPQDYESQPQCCDRADYSLCCGHETFQLLCQDEPCKAEKCDNKCGCSKCEKCSHKRCGCGKCPKRRVKDAVIE